jgi:Tfp pilus assembly protein PilN
MGKNDLLSEDDFFAASDKPENPSDENIIPSANDEDDLFKELEFDRSDSEQQESGPEIVLDNAEDQPVPLSDTDNDPIPATPESIEEKVKEATSTYRYDFEDDAQDKVNFKPVIIIIIVIVVLAAAGYFGWDYIMGEGEPEVVEEVQQGPSPEEIARANFNASLTGKTRYHNSQISQVMSLTSDKNRLSSLMLYGNDFVFEVFSKDRAALARYLREMESKYGTNRVSLNTTTDRPGSRGGVFGQFNLTLDQNGTDKAEVADPFSSGDAVQAWLKNLANSNSLQISEVKSSSIPAIDIYRGSQYETTLRGGIEGVGSFLSQLANSNKNIVIHKLSLISTDLKNFSPKKYQLKLILKVYM